MSWERGRYYTSSSRQDGKVNRTYWGKGELGRLASQFFEAIRKEKSIASQALKKQKRQLIDVEGRVYCAHDMAKLAVQGVLEAAGFHQHDRGEWRQRRTFEKVQLVLGPAEATDAKVTSPTCNAAATHDSATNDWEGLLTAATQGKSTYRLYRDKSLSLAPDRLLSIDLAHQLIAANIDHLTELLVGDRLVEREVLVLQVDRMRADLLGEGNSRLEGMIVETIVLCFLQLSHAKKWHRLWQTTAPLTMSLVNFSHRRLGACQRRYLASDASDAGDRSPIGSTIAPR